MPCKLSVELVYFICGNFKKKIAMKIRCIYYVGQVHPHQRLIE